jgi:phosphoribosyl-AMP cyclohydrolase
LRRASVTEPHEIEEGNELMLDFSKCDGLAGMDVLPAVIQDVNTKEVLMVGYMNRQALQLSIAEGRVVLWSTTRNEFWRKGDTSGDSLTIADLRTNCEQNSLLVMVRKESDGVCHTRGADGRTRPTCYYRRLISATQLAPLGAKADAG